MSALALGSWRTYERIPREQGIAVMRAAREHGIDFLDDARYDDETDRAPMRTGYSEVVFGELFRAAGWKRDEVVVSNKLWWEFWPGQSAVEEVDASLRRMGLDHLDLVYSCPASTAPPVEEIVGAVGELIASGKARAWGVCNWNPDRLASAAEIARREGIPLPCTAQLPYSVTMRDPVEGKAAVDALDASGASVVASFVLSGGILTGKYGDGSTTGRMGDELTKPDWEPHERRATSSARWPRASTRQQRRSESRSRSRAHGWRRCSSGQRLQSRSPRTPAPSSCSTV